VKVKGRGDWREEKKEETADGTYAVQEPTCDINKMYIKGKQSL